MDYSSQRSNSAASSASRPDRAWSWQRRAQHSPPAKNSELKQASYSVYNLKWPKLKAFLETRFPGCEFEEYHVLEDRYYFEIPEPLTSEDTTAIEKLRDVPPRERRSESPERN